MALLEQTQAFVAVATPGQHGRVQRTGTSAASPDSTCTSPNNAIECDTTNNGLGRPGGSPDGDHLRRADRPDRGSSPADHFRGRGARPALSTARSSCAPTISLSPASSARPASKEDRKWHALPSPGQPLARDGSLNLTAGVTPDATNGNIVAGPVGPFHLSILVLQRGRVEHLHVRPRHRLRGCCRPAGRMPRVRWTSTSRSRRRAWVT